MIKLFSPLYSDYVENEWFKEFFDDFLDFQKTSKAKVYKISYKTNFHKQNINKISYKIKSYLFVDNKIFYEIDNYKQKDNAIVYENSALKKPFVRIIFRGIDGK